MAIVSSLYRCAKCGSKNVKPYTKDGKLINPLKDILNNTEIVEFRCPDCGAVLDYPMDDEQKAALDAKELDSVGTISGALNKNK